MYKLLALIFYYKNIGYVIKFFKAINKQLITLVVIYISKIYYYINNKIYQLFPWQKLQKHVYNIFKFNKLYIIKFQKVIYKLLALIFYYKNIGYVIKF